MIGVSRSTLYRKLRDFDIDSDSYSDIAPSNLDDLLKEIKVEQPDIGEVILQGRLLHMGIRHQLELSELVQYLDLDYW